MAIKTFAASEVLTSSDTNTYLANSGLTYITSAALAGASTTVNNCFTSAYRDYRVLVVGTSNNGTAFDMTVQWMAGGSPNATSNYYSNIIFNTSGAGPSRAYVPATTVGYCGTTANPAFSNAIDIYAPQISFTTSYSTMGNAFGSTTAVVGNWFGNFNATTQFDGLRIEAGGQSLTGTITIYGYRKA